MKKFTYLLLIAVMPFVSCSSDDDDDDAVVEETMIGKWHLSSAVMPFEGQEMPVPLTDCDKKTTLEFGEDGSFTTEAFSEFSGECTSEGAYGETWEDKGNDVYTLTYDSQGQVDDYTITVSGSTMTVYYAGNEETGGTEMTTTWTRIN